MATIEELEAERDRARMGVMRLETAHSADLRRLTAEFERKLRDELDAKYKKPLAELKAAEATAQAALDAALVAVAGARELPKGTLYEWRRKESRPWARDYALRPTGRRGVLEVVTRGSAFPSNQGSWRRPAVGTVIVRLLKKDGSPSLMWETWHENPVSHQANWLPAGVKPEGAAEGAETPMGAAA